MTGPCRHQTASCSPCTAAGATRAAASLGRLTRAISFLLIIRVAVDASNWSQAVGAKPRPPRRAHQLAAPPASLSLELDAPHALLGSRTAPQGPPRAAMVAPTDAPAAAPAGKAAGPPYGLPPLPAIPCPDFRGPTPWSNWVIKGRLLAGARQGRGCAAGHGGLAAGGRALLGSTHQAAKCRSCPPPGRRLPRQPG